MQNAGASRSQQTPQLNGDIGLPGTSGEAEQLQVLVKQGDSATAPISNLNRSNGFYTLTLAPGETKMIAATGTQFYVAFTTNDLEISPSPGGQFNVFGQGTGLQYRDQDIFNLLQVRNPSTNATACQIFVGWGQYIDNRLILFQQQQPTVVFPTYPIANAANTIAIPDQSGKAIVDINGIGWIAAFRIAVVVGNTSTGTTLLLQKAGATTTASPAVVPIYPQTSMRLEIAGDYSIFQAGPINAIVSELYSALKP